MLIKTGMMLFYAFKNDCNMLKFLFFNFRMGVFNGFVQKGFCLFYFFIDLMR